MCDITEPDILFNGLNCENVPFYALQLEPAYGYLNVYQAKIGDCILSIKHPDGEAFNPKDLLCVGSCAPAMPCGTPTGLVATQISGNSATLNWTAVPGATSYSIQWRALNSTWNTVSSSSNSFQLSGLMPCTTYEFKVQAICPDGVSIYTTSVQFTTGIDMGTCGPPNNLSGVYPNATTVETMWSVIAGASSYDLQWRDDINPGAWNTISGITGNMYTINGVPSLCTQFRVRAICNGVPGEYSCPERSCFGTLKPNPVQTTTGKPFTPSQSAKMPVTSITDPFGVPMIVSIECLSCMETNCDESELIANNSLFNPFFFGVLGNWRPESSYAFDDKNTRNYSSGKLETQGYYTAFSPFWRWIDGVLSMNPLNWVRASTVTKYDKAGNPIEEKDALNKHETALYGFKNTLPMARSSNSRYTQIAYEGFEDNEPPPLPCTRKFCHQKHFPYTLSGAALSNEQAHSGKYSIKLNDTNNKITFSGGKEPLEGNFPEVFSSLPADAGKFKLGPNGNIGVFQPIGTTDRRYVVSAWVYSDKFNCDQNARSNPPEILSVPQTAVLPNEAKPTGPIIDGWRKIEATIIVPASTTTLDLVFTNTLGGTMYIDDVRVHPFDGSMQSFAYDPFSLRLMASLDERNYATFFEYDDAGILVRTKRETEKGIITVNESKAYLTPNN